MTATRRAVRRGARVAFAYPTAGGVVVGRGRVVRVIDKAPCGASGWEQFIYLVDDGADLRVIPADYLTEEGER